MSFIWHNVCLCLYVLSQDEFDTFPRKEENRNAIEDLRFERRIYEATKRCLEQMYARTNINRRLPT